MLSPEQILFYQREGYLVVEELFCGAQLDALRRQCEECAARSASVSENDATYDLEDSHRAAQPRVRRIKEAHKHLVIAGELTREPRLVAILKQLIGTGVRFQSSKLNMKAASYGAPVEWHQDWAFYPHTNQDLLAIGIMMDDMTEDNGPLLVMPGSHRGPIYDHHHDGYFCGAIDPQRCDLDFSKAVALTGPAGCASFHHVRMVHGSALNQTEQARRLLIFQYTAVDAWPLVNFDDDIDNYDRFIVAGEPTRVPRLEDVPVRLPLPPAPHQGSIYENQRGTGRRYFDQFQEMIEAV